MRTPSRSTHTRTGLRGPSDLFGPTAARRGAARRRARAENPATPAAASSGLTNPPHRSHRTPHRPAPSRSPSETEKHHERCHRQPRAHPRPDLGRIQAHRAAQPDHALAIRQPHTRQPDRTRRQQPRRDRTDTARRKRRLRQPPLPRHRRRRRLPLPAAPTHRVEHRRTTQRPGRLHLPSLRTHRLATQPSQGLLRRPPRPAHLRTARLPRRAVDHHPTQRPGQR